MSCPESEFANKFALRPVVSFAQGMCSVQFAEKVGGAPGKGIGIKTNEIVFSRQFR